MPGFDPLGSTPVGSILSTSAAPGTVVAPGSGSVTLTMSVPVITGISTVRVDLILRESLAYQAATAKVSSILREALTTRQATVVSRSLIRESLVSSVVINSARIRGVFREALTSSSLAKVSFLAREILMSSFPAPVSGGFVTILW